MSLFLRTSKPRVERRTVSAAIPPPTESDRTRRASLRITPDVAMQHSAVAACVLKIRALGALEPHSYRTVDGVTSQDALDPPILREPSPYPMYFAERWRRELFDAWLRRGTAFGMVTSRDSLLYPTKIELISADSVSLRPSREGERAMGTKWIWMVDGKEQTPYPDGPLWIAPGPYTAPGIPVGISPIEMALGAIRLGLAAEDYGASWFYDGGQPSGVLTTEQVVEHQVATTIKQRFIEALRSGGVATLGAGMEYTPVQVAANESQFLETLDKNVATVCRYFLMPPEEVGGTSGNSLTYSNVEARGLSLLIGTYGPWLSWFESTMNAITPRIKRIRTDTDGLLRLDAKTRTELDVLDVRAGLRSREEIRQTRGLGDVDTDHHIVWPPFASGTAALQGGAPDSTSPGAPGDQPPDNTPGAPQSGPDGGPSPATEDQ